MSATNRYKNVTAAFTPTSGTSTPITGVHSAAINLGISRIKEGGDGDVLPTVAFNDYSDPTVDLETIDAFALEASLVGVVGTLVLTIPDATNGTTTSGGGKTVTFINCSIQAAGGHHAHRAFGKRNLTFGGYSSDGQTSFYSSAAL